VADNHQLVTLAVVGAAGFAAYQFLYRPWAMQRDLEALTRAQIQANLARGMSITDAAANAVAGACAAGAAAYKVPPAISGSICQGVGVLAVAGAKQVAKGAVIAGKVLGKGVGKGVGKGAKAVGTGAKKAVKSISHGFGLWGLEGLEDVARTKQPRRARGPSRTKQSAAAFYLRHL
jgi:hypothetical protein